MKHLALNPIVISSISTLLILFLIFIANRQISSVIATPKKSKPVTSTTHAKLESLQSDPSKDQIHANQPGTYIDEGIKLDHINSQQFEQDDLISLFQTMEGVNNGVHKPYVSTDATLKDNEKVVKAFADLEAFMKMTLNEIANSDENIHRLENVLNFFSTYFSKETTHHSHDLKATIDSLHQEIQSVLSSFKQASATIHTFTRLEEKEKYINEELRQRKQAAISLLSEIFETEKSMAAAQQKEAELKKQISMLQAELNNKEKEIQDNRIKVSSLQEQKKKSVSDTMGFMKEFEIVKKDKPKMMEDQIKAKQELEKLDIEWSSCVADLKKILHNF